MDLDSIYRKMCLADCLDITGSESYILEPPGPEHFVVYDDNITDCDESSRESAHKSKIIGFSCVNYLAEDSIYPVYTYMDRNPFNFWIYDKETEFQIGLERYYWVFFDLANMDHLFKVYKNYLNTSQGVFHVKRRINEILEYLNNIEVTDRASLAILNLQKFKKNLDRPKILEEDENILCLFKGNYENLALFIKIMEFEELIKDGIWQGKPREICAIHQVLKSHMIVEDWNNFSKIYRIYNKEFGKVAANPKDLNFSKRNISPDLVMKVETMLKPLVLKSNF